MAELRASEVTPDELAALLTNTRPPNGETAWCWLEAPDGWVLERWNGSEGNVRVQAAHCLPREEPLGGFLPRVTAGRVFAPSGELRWRVLPALGSRTCRVVFLGDAWVGLESLTLRPDLNGLTAVDESYPLWGQQTQATPEEWIELRIPHRLRYPVSCGAPGQGRIVAQLRVQLWKDRLGEVQFLRLRSLDTTVES